MRRFTSKSTPDSKLEEIRVENQTQEIDESSEAVESDSMQEESTQVELGSSELLKSLTDTIDRIDEMAEDIASLKMRLDKSKSEDDSISSDKEEAFIDDSETFDTNASQDGPSTWAKSGNDIKVGGSEKRLNLLTVSIIVIILLVLTTICWKKTLPDSSITILDVDIPAELTVNQIVEVPLNIDGTPCICVEGTHEEPIDCAIRNGNLLLKPKAEGEYTFALVVKQSDKTYVGIYKTIVVGDLGGEKYKKLSDDVATAVKEHLPAEYWSYCKAIGRNFKQVALDYNIETPDGLYMEVRKLNENTLGYNDPSLSVDAKMQATWYKFMNGDAKDGTPGVIQTLLRNASSGNSVSEHRLLFNAVADGFSRIE